MILHCIMKLKILIGIYIILSAFQLFAESNSCKIPWRKLPYPSFYFHPVHISFTNIEYDQEKGKFEILFKFYVDDFNHILKNKYGKDLGLGAGKWDKTYIDVVNKYILEHFKFIINNKDKTKSSLIFTRKEKTEDSIWFYYNISTKDRSNKFEIYNSFLTDLYMDQSNLLIFTYLGDQKAYKYNYDNIKEIFSF
jgi:hypothetical protein